MDNPIPSGTNPIALTYSYYDEYSVTSKSYSTSDNSKLGIGANAYGDSIPAAKSNHTRGSATVTRVRVIENPSDLTQGAWMETASFYDDKGRVIQTNADNYKGGLDVATNRYDFTGKVISNYLLHTNPADSANIIRVRTNMDYDHAGRLLTITKQVNDNDSTKRITVRNSYDAIGQLLRKRLGQKAMTDTSTLNNEDYYYNIRGWLKGMNWNYGASSGPTTSQMNTSSNKWFAMDLSYDWGFGSNEFNGNIAGQRWMSAGDGEERAFGYGYDAANRLLFADFNQKFGSWAKSSGSYGIDFSVKMGDGLTAGSAYDANGNILAMRQLGLKLNASSVIDKLAYTYNTNSNKLADVADSLTADQQLGDFTNRNTSGADYGYDDNGNLLKDRNKDIGGASTNGITYNHLNLPYKITVTGKGTITYIYDATGNKLEKRTKDTVVANKTITTDYLNGFVYENNALKFFGHEEGRIRMNHAVTITNPTVFNYDYFVKDHLGNTRVVLTDEQQIDPYPAVSLEPGSLTVDTLYYNINSSKITDMTTVSGYSSASNKDYYNNNGNPPYNTNPNINTTTAYSGYMYKLNGATGDKTGLGITLKVMTGDNVAIYGKSYWHSSSPTNTGHDISISTLLTQLANTGAVANAGKGATAAALTGSSVTPTDVSNWLSGNAPSPGSKPKAYINWILFDEQFRVVNSSSGFSLVGNADGVTTHSGLGVSIAKNGYLYVYCSNESDQDVFFDNLQVIHTRGPLLEETTYSPWGLTLAGISSKAAGKLENTMNKFQGQEYNGDLGVDAYEFKYRMDDPQIGRFWQVDPLADKYVHNSTYAFSENKVTGHVELEGKEARAVTGDELSGDPNNLPKPLQARNAQMVAAKQAGEAAVAAADAKKTSANKGRTSSDGDSNKPGEEQLFGKTITTKETTFERTLSSGFGDKATASFYTGFVTGEEGALGTKDLSTLDGKVEGITNTFAHGTAGYGLDDKSVSLGLTGLGFEGHVSYSIAGGRPAIGAGGSYTNGNKVINGGDVKLQPGLATVAIAIASIFQPYSAPVVLKLAFK
jgi:RHS repeat-associated protein